MLVISSGDIDNIPKTGLAFAKASSNLIYAFGGTTQYRDTRVDSNTVYKISLRRRGWEDHQVVMAKWSKVKTYGSGPAPQAAASILYFYNELYVLSHHVNKQSSLFVLGFTLDDSPARWTDLSQQYEQKYCAPKNCIVFYLSRKVM